MTRYCLDLDTPAAGFIDSFLLGNGWLGAIVRGGIGTERIDLNLDTVWSGGPLVPEAGESPSRFLAELRAAIRAGDFVRADQLGRQMQGERWTQSYQPLGAIELTYADAAAATGYRRRLDVANAVASTDYRSDAGVVALRSFASNPDGVLVSTFAGTPTRALQDIGVDFAAPHPGMTITVSEEANTRWLVAAGRVPSNVAPNYVRASDAVAYATDAPDDSGSVASGMGFAVVAALQADDDGGIRLIASAASGYRGSDQRPNADLEALASEARQRVAAVLAVSTATLQRRHSDEYRSYFDRVDLDLSRSPAQAGVDPARAELLFHFGRYLLISSSRPGTQAANLQGIWNVDVRPAWSANYTININTQMNYWPAELAGLPELHQPMFDLTRDLATAGAVTARRYYDAAGATAHHNADLWRFTAPVPGIPQWSNWPSGLYWMSAHLRQHLEYGSAGPDFVASYARPVLGAATAFALDMLVEGGDGMLAASPSTSPEHSFLVEGDTPVAITAGTAMDQELIHEALEGYLSVAPPGDALAARARDALPRLRLPAIGRSGNLLEWDDDKRPAELGHRHLSHLYGLYPGTRITETGTPRDFAAVGRALALRLDNGTGYTGWSQAWVLCLAARLRDRELAQQSISGLLDKLTSRALLVLHPHDDWPGGNVFQIDGNFGAVAGLAELLVQSHEGAISLLKTLPASWTDGTVTAIRCRGGHRASVSWSGGRFDSATIGAGRSGPLVLDLPTGNFAVSDFAGVIVTEPVDSAPAGRVRITWTAIEASTYTVSRQA